MVTWSVYTVKADSDEFQSTPSLRMVTKEAAAEAAPAEISIHTILADGDDQGAHIVSERVDFNPHHPCGW